MASLAELLVAKKKKQNPEPEIKIEVEPPKESEIISNSEPAPSDCSQEVSDIITKIRSLNQLSELDLRGAMDALKLSLLQNPTAVDLMLPEDIGEMVKALMKITGEVITEQATKKRASKKAKNLSADEIAAAFEEL